MSQNPSPSASIKAGLPDYFLLALIIFILAQIIELLLPFLGALLSAVVIGIVFYPFHEWLAKYLPRRSPAAKALITDGFVLLFFIVPLVLLIWIVVNEAQALAPTLKQWRLTIDRVRDGGMDAFAPLKNLRQWLNSNFGVQPEQFSDKLGDGADRLIQAISVSAAGFAKNSIALIMDLLVIAFTLFFIFRDGPQMAQRFQSYVPLRAKLKIQIAHKMHGTVVGVLRGVFLTSMVQGLTASIGYLIAGVPAVAVLGFLTAIVGLIPSIGTGLVWLPLSIFYIIKHDYFKGFFLLGWGIFVVGLLDNFLRPYFIRGKTELPFLALFFALLGGIQVWGLQGIVLGPLLMSILPVLLDAYRQSYLSEKETVGNITGV